jgi:hypothetical protein
MGRLFICIMDSRCSRIDPYGTLCFIVLQSEKKFLVVWGDFTSDSLIGPEPIFSYSLNSTEV